MFDLKSARHWAEELQREAIGEGMAVIDATMGNGGDTERLCQLVGETGRVYAFDVQAQAVENTRARLTEAGLIGRAQLNLAGHERVLEFVHEPVDAVVFNLGWLPGAEHGVTTRVDTTLAAVNAALAAFNRELLGQHIKTCVKRDILAGKDETIDELLTTLQKLMK